MSNRLYIFPIAIVVVIFDQLTKFLVSQELLVGERINLINNIISLTKAYNTGAAFSILEGKTIILALFSLLVAIAIILYFALKPIRLPSALIVAWGLILGGTIGNMLDRLILGYVIDFIKLDFINFPIFNIADISINIGALLIISYSIAQTIQEHRQKKTD